jgi:mannose-6-phosphate isomerase-like protein (cupin superfamily)
MKLVKKRQWLEREGYLKKILFDENELKLKGSVVQIVKVKAHSKIKPHYHKQMTEVYCILKGNATLFFGNKKFKAKRGMYSFVNLGIYMEL